jgi:hypothetical protein
VTDRNKDEQQNLPEGNPLTGMQREPGFSPNLSFSQPGSPTDETGTTPAPPSSGLGASDPMGGDDVVGDDQIHDRGIVDTMRDTAANRGASSGADSTDTGTDAIHQGGEFRGDASVTGTDV